ncbi:MAG: DNA-binding GntR family transcriptional regulator [Parasphingorhabdus sp.]|jgi:DNA-binding GntR family transcriptional regulator
MSNFKAIDTSTRLADEVYQQVLNAIAAGNIDPHKRIVQEWLADQLQVSRTPVREALIRLENEGVLARVGRSGYQIRSIDDEEVQQIYEAREAIECHAVAYLTRAGDQRVVARLRKVIQSLDETSKQNTKDYFDANQRVHRAFVVETNNPFLLEMFDALWNRSISFYLFSEMVNVDLPESLDDHLLLCDAIENGDDSEAARTMREHISHGLDLQRNAIAINRSVRDAQQIGSV